MRLPHPGPHRWASAAGVALLLTALTAAPAMAETWVGNDAANTHTGTETADVLKGMGGADTIYARGGADEVYGGDGADNLYGGDGPDTMYGGFGLDEIVGGAGDDHLFAQDGDDDTVACGEGSDTVTVDWGDRVGAECEVIHRRVLNYGDLLNMFGSRVGDRATVEVGLENLQNQMEVGDINNARRASAYLATILNESRFEYDALQAGSSLYRGRGFIQLTGEANYRAAAGYFNQPFATDVGKTRELPWSGRIARWYWSDLRNINDDADRMDMGAVSRLIGYADSAAEDAERCEDFKRAMRYLTGTRPADGDVICRRHS